MVTSIFGIYCVDAWLIYCGCDTYLLHTDPQLNQQEFYSALAVELVDNNIWLSRDQIIFLARTDQPNNALISHDTINPIPELQAKHITKRGRYVAMKK